MSERVNEINFSILDLAHDSEDRDAVGQISDGSHTFSELYDFRAVLHATACKAWQARLLSVSKSWRHNEGELCFGGGWFIVTAELPTGQVSNHYEAKWWDLFEVQPVERAPVWDGHTSEEALQRMKEWVNA